MDVSDSGNEIEIIEIESPFREVVRMYFRNKAAVAGLCIFVFIVALSVIGPMIYAVDPYDIVYRRLAPPGDGGFMLGTDYIGRDVTAGIVHGAKATLVVGASAALCTILIGVFIGAFAGFYSGWVDNMLMRITEFFQVLPPLLLSMVLVTIFSPTLTVIALAIGVVSWPPIARLTRGEFLKIRQQEYVMAGRAVGAKERRLIWKVIFPNALPPLIVSSTLIVGTAILFEAGLSFLGLGDPNIMSWGLMIGASRDYIFESWWAVTFPGIAIFLTVLSVSLIGDGLTYALNPKLREI